MRRLVGLLLAWLAAAPAGAQAVSGWAGAGGVPVAAFETPGGDLEHLTVVVPPDLGAPAAVMGYPLAVARVGGAQLWTASVPSLLALPAVAELGAALGNAARGAVVAVGPVAARELHAALDALASGPRLVLPRPACVLAEGAQAVVRGSPARAELRFAALPADDPRDALLPALAAWLRLRLSPALPGLQVDSEGEDGCARLALTVPAGGGEARDALRRLRAALADLAATPPTDEDARRVRALLGREAAAWAGDGAAVASSLAELAARGGDVALRTGPPWADPAALRSIFTAVVAGHAGAARLVEPEPRTGSAATETLENGVVLGWRPIAGETAVIGVALGPVDPAAAADAAQAVAAALAAGGWAVQLADVLGIETVGVAVPAEDTVPALERLAAALAAWRPAGRGESPATRLLGLAPHPSAASLSVALALPEGAETAVEGAVKFFAELPATRVAASAAVPGGTLSLTPAPGPARITTVVGLPPTPAGLVAGEVVAARLASAGLDARFLTPAGQVALVLTGSRDGDVPSFDAALASAWRAALAPVPPEEVRAAARRLIGRLFGDLVLSVQRAAAAPFLPALPAPAVLLGTETTEVAAVLAGLPAWVALPRAAVGPVPVVELPRGAVRKSPSRPPGRR